MVTAMQHQSRFGFDTEAACTYACCIHGNEFGCLCAQLQSAVSVWKKSIEEKKWKCEEN